MIIFDEYGQPDYEAMILERQEHYDLIGNCDGICEECAAKSECYAFLILRRMKMLRTECEALIGFKLGYSDYEKIIEPMYNALPDNDPLDGHYITKEDFVRMLNPAYFYRRSKEWEEKLNENAVNE